MSEKFVFSHGDQFDYALLTDGTGLKNPVLTRLNGYDTTVWVTGETEKGNTIWAPREAIVSLTSYA